LKAAELTRDALGERNRFWDFGASGGEVATSCDRCGVGDENEDLIEDKSEDEDEYEYGDENENENEGLDRELGRGSECGGSPQ